MQHTSCEIHVLYAGSLQALMDELLPAFMRQTGYTCVSQSGGSLQWARQLRQGSIQADIFMSADAAVNEAELMRPGEEKAEWYLVFATSELVLAYSPTSPSAYELKTLASNERGWLRLLQGGYRLARPDPDIDPKGYRTLFALQLAEKHIQAPGLVGAVTGTVRNAKQIVAAADLAPLLRRGEIDIAFMYRTQVEGSDIPFVSLPDAVSLGSPEHAPEYAMACYKCSDGSIYRGTPITYTITPLKDSRNSLAQSAFLCFLTSLDAVAAIRRHSFRPERMYVRPVVAE